jgi:hypothetical protein
MYNGHVVSRRDDDCYIISTLEGAMEFYHGDMLIAGINGEIYPCKTDIFEKTYEKV